MKKTMITLGSILLLSTLALEPSVRLVGVETRQVQPKLHWHVDYDQALAQAKRENKPLVLFFTGSDWCTWCHRLEQEALDTQEFQDKTAEHFVFVKLDFPMRTFQDPVLKEKNAKLQKKHNIKGYPTVVVIDPSEKVLGESGYKQGGGTKYAEQLVAMKGAYPTATPEPVIAKVQTEEELKKNYFQALEDGDKGLALELMDKGVELKENDFFLLEKYDWYLAEGLGASARCKSVREEIEKKDPFNSKGYQFDLALSEFTHAIHEFEAKNVSVSDAIQPLVAYLEKFGHQDTSRAFLLEWTIAEVLQEASDLEGALTWANLAKVHAPEEEKASIESFIAVIETKKEEIALEQN